MSTDNYKKILILCAVLAVGIIGVSVIFALKNDEPKTHKTQTGKEQSGELTPEEPEKQEVMIKAINLDASVITVEYLSDGQEASYIFTGGSDIRTKTGRNISAAMLSPGNIVKISTDENGKLLSLYGHDRVWSYKNVERMKIYTDPKKIEVGSAVYRYDRLNVLNDEEFVSVDSILPDGTDIFDLYGIDDRILLIKVSTGHGYLTLQNEGDFIGGTIHYGVGKSAEVTENLNITLREGDYDITVENNGNEARATVRIKNTETTSFDLDGYGPEPVVYGEVVFKIDPAGSDLYIDGVKTDYKDPVKLIPGTHEIEAVLGGYNSYKGAIDVDAEGCTKQIKLSPAPQEKPEDIVYEETNGGENSVTPPVNNGSNVGEPIRDGTDNADLSEYSNVDIPGSTSDDGDNGKIEVIDGDKQSSLNSGINGGNPENNNNGKDKPGGISIVVSGDGEDEDGNEEAPDNQDLGKEENGNNGSGENGNGNDAAVPGDTDRNSESTGRLVIRTSDGAGIYINGEYKGTVKNGELKVEKPPGVIELELKKDGYVTKKYTITLDDEEEEEVYRFPEMTPES